MKTIIKDLLERLAIIGLKVLDGYWLGIGFTLGVFWVLKVFTDLFSR